MNQDQINHLMYLISFLSILIDRAGGELVIENLSEYAAHDMQIGMKLDKEGDKVTLVVLKSKAGKQHA